MAIENHKSKETTGKLQKIDIIAMIRDLWQALGKVWWKLLLLVVVVIGLFSVYRYRSYVPMYESKATFTVGTSIDNTSTTGFYYSSQSAAQLSSTFPYVLQSQYFRSILMEKLDAGYINGSLSAQALGESNVVTMRVTSGNAEDAKKILDAAIEVYPDAAYYILGRLEFSIIDSPDVPQTPMTAFSWVSTIITGGMVACMLAVLVLVVYTYATKTVKRPEEMAQITSLNCMAALPETKNQVRKKGTHKQRISMMDRRLPYGYKESIRALQMRLELNMRRSDAKVIMLTSTVADEGKSTLAINLAESMAQKGKKVLLIDADMRKQETAKTLECGDGMGLQDIFGDEAASKGMIRWLENGAFWFLGSERPVARPARILSHPKVGNFIDGMKEQFDYIILDTAPCGLFQDAAVLSEFADVILYIVRHGHVSQAKIQEGISFLNDRKAKVLGYVFNFFPQNSNEYGYGKYGYGKYGYGYGYGYGSKYGYNKSGYGKYGYGEYGYGELPEEDK